MKKVRLTVAAASAETLEAVSPEQFVGLMLDTRNQAHLEHWRTGSDEVHRALNDFYEQQLEATDLFVECYQGRFDTILQVATVQTVGTPTPIERLDADAKLIRENLAAISGGDPALGNVLQDLLAKYYKTLYKLRKLH